MATLQGPATFISTNRIFGASDSSYSPNMILDFARVATTRNDGSYFHIKTNMQKFSDQMYTIEAEGYNYGKGQGIRTAWCGYLYNSAANPLVNTSQYNAYPGLTAHSQYLSADGYLVIVAYASSTYFCGFNLSVYRFSPGTTAGYGNPVSMLDWTYSTVSGAQY